MIPGAGQPAAYISSVRCASQDTLSRASGPVDLPDLVVGPVGASLEFAGDALNAPSFCRFAVLADNMSALKLSTLDLRSDWIRRAAEWIRRPGNRFCPPQHPELWPPLPWIELSGPSGPRPVRKVRKRLTGPVAVRPVDCLRINSVLPVHLGQTTPYPLGHWRRRRPARISGQP
jgi:hypothetical protein